MLVLPAFLVPIALLPFSVTLTARPAGGAVLTVADEGPGFPPSATRRGTSGGDSTGLGLDIARRLATTFETTGGPTGAVVRLELPGS